MKIEKVRISFLRQYINEDCVGDDGKAITNSMILFWLTGEKKYLKEDEEEKEDIEKMMSKFFKGLK